jgi:hypothetical protein
MIVTEFYHGQGLGNQLAVYVTTRVIAQDKGLSFGCLGLENFGDRRYNDKGLYFMDLDLGDSVDISKITNQYEEKGLRLRTNASHHDSTIGCDIRLIDPNLINVPDNTQVKGIMQGEDYIYHRKKDIKQWLKVKPEHDCYDFTNDDICVINFRDYRGSDELYLQRPYWVNAIKHMLNINPNMQFLVITENPAAAIEMLPELADNTYHFDVGKDYSIIKNAKWLILSNSSFAVFPAWTSDTARMVIAPKYWARHNVSNGYWSCSYNLYRDWLYMDRSGILFSYDECKRELNHIIKNNPQIYNQ